MVTRSEGAAATRRALVLAASELLDEGGPDAVTLRAVGARAGVSRGAPYGHFENKERLLTELAIAAWNTVADSVQRLREGAKGNPRERLESALLALIRVARRQPHLYSLMFSTPANDPESVAASGRLQNEFLAVVADLVGPADAPRYGALVMSSAHGIAGLEISGHLDKDAWTVDGDQLVGMLVAAIETATSSAGDF